MIRRRSGRWCALLSALLAVLVGCTSLPESGPVNSAPERKPERSSVDVLYSGPASDADPREIVSGFLTASGSGYSDSFAAAKEYLSPQAAEAWNPYAGVEVADSAEAPLIEEGVDGEIRVTTKARASVDSAGRYAPKLRPVIGTRSFSLMRNEDNQWRIVSLPDGIIVPDATFEQIFDRVPLYFYSPDAEVLVPELRWFPRQTMVVSAARALVQGPSSWLAPGVATAVPEGASLDGGVEFTDGVVRVNVRVEGTRPSEEQLQRFYVQAQRTLGSLGGVESLVVNVNSVPVVPRTTAPLISPPTKPAQPVLVVEGQVARWNGRDAVPVSPGENDVVVQHPSAPLEGTGAPLVVQTEDGAIRTFASAQARSEELLEPGDWSPPALDRLGWVWAASGDNAGSIEAVAPTGRRVSVSAPQLAGNTVERLHLSPDGAKIVFLTKVGQTPLLRVAPVVRDPDGTPREVRDAIEVTLPPGPILDADWADSLDLVVLVGDSPGTAGSVVYLSLGGPRTILPSVAGAVQVAAGNSERSLVVVSSDGTFYTRAGAGWRAAATGVRDPNYGG
ncbi:MAG: LpqB family beta-propeller domain-containing protein [Bowdeniella nasicola]|nr:LpqB family beta-propeller domain-containing protein [Bowdeniella nasicola]